MHLPLKPSMKLSNSPRCFWNRRNPVTKRLFTDQQQHHRFVANLFISLELQHYITVVPTNYLASIPCLLAYLQLI
jgi:hypothetical protein